MRIPTKPGNRIRVFPASDNSASALLFFYGCDGLHIRACTRRRRCVSAVLRFGTKAHSRIVGFVEKLTMTQPLVTADERAQLLANGAARRRWPAASTRCPWCGCSRRTRMSPGCWLSLDPADGDTAYGLIDLGIGMPELGNGQAVRPGGHRRAAPAAGAARSVFPGDAPVVGVRPAGAGATARSPD